MQYRTLKTIWRGFTTIGGPVLSNKGIYFRIPVINVIWSQIMKVRIMKMLNINTLHLCILLKPDDCNLFDFEMVFNRVIATLTSASLPSASTIIFSLSVFRNASSPAVPSDKILY